MSMIQAGLLNVISHSAQWLTVSTATLETSVKSAKQAIRSPSLKDAKNRPNLKYSVNRDA